MQHEQTHTQCLFMCGTCMTCLQHLCTNQVKVRLHMAMYVNTDRLHMAMHMQTCIYRLHTVTHAQSIMQAHSVWVVSYTRQLTSTNHLWVLCWRLPLACLHKALTSALHQRVHVYSCNVGQGTTPLQDRYTATEELYTCTHQAVPGYRLHNYVQQIWLADTI